MTRSDHQRLIVDPEAQQLPATAEDDPAAEMDEPSSRGGDGWDPYALPADHPIAVEDFGTTAEEQRQGESLDDRLKRERPDQWIADLADGPEVLSDAIDDIPLDTPVDTDDPRLNRILEAEDPALDSHVSVYDRLPGIAAAGRLIQPDEGMDLDEEQDAYAEDRRLAGGGFSAEEEAIHEEI